VNAGLDVAEELTARGTFDWETVSAAEAVAGVRDGRYDFTLTIPSDFSAALTSSATFDPEQAQLRMTTDDASAYLSTTFAGRVTEEVRDALAARVGTEAASNFLLGISETRAGLLEATQGATGLLDGLERAGTGTDKLAEEVGQVADAGSELGEELAVLTKDTKRLPDRLDAVATDAREMADDAAAAADVGDRVTKNVDEGTQSLTQLRAKLRAELVGQGATRAEVAALLALYDDTRDDVLAANKRIDGALDDLGRLAPGADAVADANDELSKAVPKLLDGIDESKTHAEQLGKGATTLSTGARGVSRGLEELAANGTRLRNRLQEGADRIPVMDAKARDKIAQTIGDPVRVESLSSARARTYGEGLAPYFLPLAAWIGAYALFLLLRPLSTRAVAANQGSLRVVLGGWLPAALLASAQTAVLAVAVLLVISVRPVDLAGTFAFLLLTSAAFVAILHCLNAWFGRVGQFVGLMLLVVQAITLGGAFPWQTIPESLHWLHQVLPMTYAAEGLRQLMYGGVGPRVGVAAAVLAAYLLVALLLTGQAARRRRVWTMERVEPELVA
jgi:putative membrane protein